MTKALAYARAVVSGKIPACLYTKQACQRQLDDIGRYRSHPLYEWSEAHAGRVCRFIERLPHIAGPKANAGELIVLEPWQCFILTTVFGWRRRDTGGRRFRRAYVEVPRGNGKSCLASGVALYCLAADGEAGAQVYAAATGMDQARIVFDASRDMLRKRLEFANGLGLAVGEHRINHPPTNSVFRPLSRETKHGTKDGGIPHCAILDELHAHPTRYLYDVIETGMAKRLASLMWVITTAGDDTSGICYEVRDYCLRVLDGSAAGESQFGIIYTVDPGDDPFAPLKPGGSLDVWRKANPNWGVSVQPDEFTALAEKAAAIPSSVGNWLRKHLDIWTRAGATWMPMEAWDACADPSLDEQQFSGETCTIGLDLASVSDFAAAVRLFSREIRGSGPQSTPERHFYAFLSAYLPENAVRSSGVASYAGWQMEGFITTTEGAVLDFEAVKRDIRSAGTRFRVREVVYDPWQAAQLEQEMTAEGFTMIKSRQIVAEQSAPMKMLLSLVLSGRFHHDGNKVFRWMISNVIAYEDSKENIAPKKDRPEKKIDGAVALIMALGSAMKSQGEQPSPYETDTTIFC